MEITEVDGYTLNLVLILIIMEDTHGVYQFDHIQINSVLILIIMEDTHGVMWIHI